MFQRLREAEGRIVSFTLNGRDVTGMEGDTVASALLAVGQRTCRTTPVSGAERGPFCMMGVCFDCLVMIDGVGNRQGCLVALREGMHVQTQDGKRKAGA